MNKGATTLNSEILKQIAKIDEQIKAEIHLYEAMRNYKDCDLKAKVMQQATGVVRGLEIGKEALEYVLAQQANDQMQMWGDEWLTYENQAKAAAKDSMYPNVKGSKLFL